MKPSFRVGAVGVLGVGIPLLVVAQLLIHPLLVFLPDSIESALAAPMVAASKVLPGLLLGWFAQRNPFIWAALAAVVGTVAVNAFGGAGGYEPFSLFGSAVAAAIYVGLASALGWSTRSQRALTGRSSGPPSATAEIQR